MSQILSSLPPEHPLSHALWDFSPRSGSSSLKAPALSGSSFTDSTTNSMAYTPSQKSSGSIQAYSRV
ncbi:hypothetical protein VI817_009842 [Penicillium citrinum]|nr:hypothetical protein VI817_009842 [Penicillium citrinum]